MISVSMQDAIALPALNAGQLLKQYTPESAFFFASPTRTLLAQGVHDMILEPIGADRGERLTERIARTLAAQGRTGHGLPIAVGAVPFNSTSPAHLIVPRTIQGAGPLNPAADALRRAPVSSIQDLRRIPEPCDYVRGVELAVELMRTEALSKVVLSRMLDMTLREPVDLRLVLQRLSQQNRSGYTFAANLSDPAAGMSGPERSAASARPRTLLGASPELLLSRSGLRVIANPLAGSAIRSPDPDEDRRRAIALLASEKDRHEHAIVVDAVAAALRPFCRRLNVPEEPSLTQTATLWHLSSRLTGELHDLSISSMKLAAALHPTPAVCGHPTERARAAIASIEPFDRGYFTGLVGWCDAAGDGEWAVVIRCADIAGRSLRLYAGAGIVVGSDGDRELAETSAKLGTMLNALGLDQAPGVT
ncbi:isochorismate synthase [Sorangium cellulosum]|uniref:isochorismate synthase n=1 Tax=Sorangium cellulosum TaxID=56 RepID=A0A2L0EV96_SORCE|nr:isochorismate synthase DhbC [Sorangium cellulosum]AUX43226.1 isochorismate synthase [Sorangium cellulosum]